MTSRSLNLSSLVASLVLAALHVGCTPDIGDDCQTSIECSQTGDRLCDVTQPGGYCTQFNCEPGTCPDEANCVAFDARLSPLAGCRDDNGASRIVRAFCMKTCDGNEDCRDGYVCEDLKQRDNKLNALAVDADRSGKVCVVAFETKSVTPEDRSDQVCTGAGGAPSSD
jgi:hypothetical protein